MTDLIAAMTGCPACEAWQQNPRSGHYRADCPDCQARALAGSPAAFKVAAGGSPDDLRSAIAAVFGSEREKYAAGRKLVAAWIERWKGVKA